MQRLSFFIQLFIISNLFTVVKCHNLFSNAVDSTLNPNVIMKNCTIRELCTGSVNSSSVYYYAVQYTFTPNTTVSVTTNMKYSIEQDAPILVVVRQIRGIVSWTLPYTFPNGMIYSNVSRILCLHNEANRTETHLTTVFIEISTSNTNLIEYSIQLDNVTEYSLQVGVSHQFDVSPSMPVYYKYKFPPTVESVFIEVESQDQLCTSVSVQSFDCPVYDVNEIGIRQGHYQTMSKSASFNVHSKEFPKRNEFLLVFIVKPTDFDCLNDKESTMIQPAGVVDVPRKKNAVVKLQTTTYYNYLLVAIFVTGGLFFLIYLIAFGLMCKYKDTYDGLDTVHLASLEVTSGAELAERRASMQRSQTNEDESSTNAYARQTSAMEVIQPEGVGYVTVQQLCVREYIDLKQKFRIYPHTMVTIAIFYSLPVIQLVLQYQLNIDSIGNEDICYFNFLCTRQLFKLTAFNNIFSNIGYCALGILFFLIVFRRDKAYTQFLSQYPAVGKKYGIPQHFGLFYAMAIALFMEGVMSACYHVCPSRQNFQFDTSFMFIIAVLNLIKIYQKRHPDINPGSTGAFSFLAIIIFINVIGVYFDKQWFWITYAIIHIITSITFTGKIYYIGKLKFTVRVHVHLYRLMKDNGFFSWPLYPNRIGILILANLLNMGFAIYGAVYKPESFPNHLLFVFLGNLALYLVYYIIMKAIHREHFTSFSIAFLLLSLMLWISSMYFFYHEVKSYEVKPAISRTYNQRCILLNTYDSHDIWHILSSFAMFFSFLSILTIDDGVRIIENDKLAAF
ncbi:unnamed protein product [Adineta steineri]|uniref:Uncharacterized protein n=2 Tax=Adineta steineri TaxID=433720 RepID=A0A813PL46_9BILA|nr:unnamed protein product [Adineta steineri]